MDKGKRSGKQDKPKSKSKSKAEQRRGSGGKTMEHQEPEPVLTSADYSLFLGPRMINSRIIMAYLYLIKDRALKDPSLTKVTYLDSLFMEGLIQNGYTSPLKDKIKKADIFLYDLVFVPYFVNGKNWVLLCVDFRQRLIVLYDSLLILDNYYPHLTALYSVIRNEATVRRNIEVLNNITTWRMGREETWPMQDYVNDDGLFLCLYAETLSRQVPAVFSTRYMNLHRSRIMIELRDQKIQEPNYGLSYFVDNAMEILKKHEEDKKMYPIPVDN